MSSATRRYPLVALLAAAMALGGCGGSSQPSSHPRTDHSASPVAAEAGRILFRRFLDDTETHGALFVASPSGADERQLTQPGEGVVDDEPAWAPDGTHIAFTRITSVGTEHESHRIYVMAADGSGLTALSPDRRARGRDIGGFDSGPAFSPDGSQVAFAYAHGRVAIGPEHGIPEGSDQLQFSDIVVMDVDGTHRRQLTDFSAYSGDSGGVAWSPDGTQLVYGRFNSAVSDTPDCRALFVMMADGRDNHQLTPCDLGAGGTPGWSGAGLIVFRAVVDDESGIGNFYTVRADGSALTQVSHFDGTVISHKVGFSPDGSHIVFARASASGANDVFTAALDGSDTHAVTDSPLADSSPDWGRAP
jgi:Tol biopolymer transport system component